MRKIFLSLLIASVPLLNSAHAYADTASITSQERSILTGSDRDSHGCIPSAGYMWESTLEKCIRIWEINKENKKDIIKIQENLIKKGFLKIPANVKKGTWGPKSKQAYEQYFKSTEQNNNQIK